jgi:putative nucleotidyltransferase with HDIG domain
MFGMIKKIPVDQLQIGMFIHDLNCGWMAHPFLTSQFKVKDPDTVMRILEAGIREVYIDTRRGTDFKDAQTLEEARAELEQELQAIVAADDEAAIPQSSLAEELVRARKLHGETQRLVRGMMHDIRLGKQIEVEQCEPLVDGIFNSIFRNPDALLPLSQVKTRDEYTFQHSVSVSALAVAFGRALKLPRAEIREFALGALLHDVGKARVPDGILNKPGKLTDEEFSVMKSHAEHGSAVLAEAQGKISRIALNAAAEHHERYDGTGYPRGLRGDAISRHGQMMAIVDVYDAITSVRVYHKGMPPTDALRKLFEWGKFHFNPALVQAFIKSIGIYPAGSLVRLESGQLGIVKEINPEKLLQPVVKVIFHVGKNYYLTPKLVDLAKSADKIVSNESYEKWGIDQARWM